MASVGRNHVDPRRTAIAALEVIAAVAAATGLVALLDEVAPVTGLGVLYILAVLFVAIRRGLVAALFTAVLSVTALNFFFIEPRYRLTIADSHNVVALGVFLIAALVVGRLAAAARRDATEAQRRALLAAAREREAKILADAASSLLAGSDLEDELAHLEAGDRLAAEAGVRVGLSAAPTQRSGELAVPLPASRPGWVYGSPEAGWDRGSLERLAEALAGLLDVAHERRRLADRSAEAEATRRADVAKTALLHAISHDLRSPLTAITTAASGLRQEPLASDDREALVDAIQAESRRLARLVDDLLDLSRIEAGAVNPRTDWCDLNDVVASAVSQVAAREGEHLIDLDLPIDLPLVRADPAQLERVFSNLLSNAIKFSPEGSPVRVSGGSGAGKVTVRVSDRGRGIPRRKRAEIFEPFVRGGDSHGGSGLGLAICRGLAEANGGEIRLESARQPGATFAVSFPLVAQPVASHG
jgi:two-component system, OmpR family, sensor histidine kinase KdpD